MQVKLSEIFLKFWGWGRGGGEVIDGVTIVVDSLLALPMKYGLQHHC